uniref:Exocyst complex component Sec10 n=1 Tax=Caenorhabditis japonica TaxID=281687 RepID=A0A8R1HPM4_CAEJA
MKCHVADSSERLEDKIADLETLQNEIYQYKGNHADRNNKMREKITELSQELVGAGKMHVNACEARLKQIYDATEPYLKSGRAKTAESPTRVTDQCIALLAKTKGIDSAIEKTEQLSAAVLQHHYLLARIEEKQRDAIARHNKIVNLEALQGGVRADDPLFHVARLPLTLFALSRSGDVDGYYQKVFEGLEQRLSMFLGGVLMKNQTNIERAENPTILSTVRSQSSSSNGEIDLKSLEDQREFPLESMVSQ